MKQKTGVYKPAALLLLITMLMLAFPIRSDAFFWNDLKRGILLQYAYVENVAKLGTCVKEDGPAGEFLKCQNGSVEWNNGKAIAVYNPFYAKWASMNWGWSPLGEPVHEVVGTWGSPQGTGGQVQFFEGGDLYLHGNGTYAGQVFEAHGLIYDKYTEVGGTGSCLGFPISDQYTASNGWLRNDFEGGYIASEDGNLYEAYCTDGSGQSSRLKPQLTSVTASCVVSGRELTKQTDNFDLTWKPFTPSDFELTFDPYKLTTSAQTEIFPAVGVIANGGDFGGVLSDLMVVNEGYKVGFSAKYGSDGLSVTGGEGDISYTVEYDTEKKGFIVTATKGSVSVQIGPKFSTSDTSITLGDVEITSLAKFIKLIKFLEATKKMDDIFKEIEQKMNVFKNLPMSGSQGGCTYTIMGVTQSYPPKETQFTDSNDAFNFATFAKPKRKPIMSYSVGYDYSNLCCPSASPSIKDKNRFYGNVGANFGKLSCESPEIPVGYGFNVGATGSLSLGASVDLSGATTCESYKICVDPKITTDASLGIFVSFIHKSLARADLIGKVNADIAWKDVCYNPDSGFDLGSINVCAQPKVVGKITGLGFLTYEIEANVGGKICPYKRSF